MEEACTANTISNVGTNCCSMADLAFFVLNFYKCFFFGLKLLNYLANFYYLTMILTVCEDALFPRKERLFDYLLVNKNKRK
jgi:hypothetical protein